MESLTVHPDHLHPNPWNPNVMNERQFEAAIESISTFGFIDPITVRDHPDAEGEYQIIDGEHRWKAAQHLNLLSVAITRIAVTDQQAKKLTIILNETRGKADTISLAELLESLSADMDAADLLTGLPYTGAELDELLSLGDFNWDDHQHDPASDPSEAADDDSSFTSFRINMPTDAYAVLQEARERIELTAPLNADPAIAWGQVLEALAAEYLAG